MRNISKFNVPAMLEQYIDLRQIINKFLGSQHYQALLYLKKRKKPQRDFFL